MEVSGPVAQLLGLYRAGSGAKGAGVPPSGSLVKATVERYLGRGVWLLDLNGTRVEARSHLALFPGQILTARVARRGASIILEARSRGQGTLETLLRHAGLPDTPGSRSLLSHLFAANGAARPQLLERFARVLRRRPGANRRLEAEALSRGLPELPEAVWGLLPRAGNPSSGDGGRSGEQETRSPQGSEREEALELRGALLRTTEVGDHPLQLFNHRARLAGGWVALPLSFGARKAGSVAAGSSELSFSGMLYLRIDESPSPPWTLDIEGGGRRFIICARAGELEISVQRPPEGAEEEEEPPVVARERAVEDALVTLLKEGGFSPIAASLPFDGVEFLDHSDLQEGIDLLQ